jgi:hypothetical protein
MCRLLLHFSKTVLLKLFQMNIIYYYPLQTCKILADDKTFFRILPLTPVGVRATEEADFRRPRTPVRPLPPLLITRSFPGNKS